jgi:Protein of unknown function (DUF1493)
MSSKLVVTIDEISLFLKEYIGTDVITPHTDIYNDLGVAGDDFHEMIAKYALKYGVNMETYIWYFHADEEGSNIINIGALFCKPPYRQVRRIPVTPIMLLNFANKGFWDIQYPAHKISNKRYDIMINRLIVFFFLVLLIALFIKK